MASFLHELNHFVSSVHEGKNPFKGNKHNVKSDNTKFTGHESAKSPNVAKSGTYQKPTFRVPNYGYSHPQELLYSSVVKGQFSPQVSASGNEAAAAAFKPLNRGGNPNQTWGQHMDQNQIQMITEIVMNLMKRNQ